MKKIFCITLSVSFLLASQYAGAIELKNAELVGVQYPANMEAGKAYPVKLTFKNTGMASWTTGTPESLTLYRAGAVGDSLTFGVNRANIVASSTPVATSESYTFNFTVTAPTNTSGKYTAYPFKWQMVNERVGWFGETTPDAPADQQIAVRYAPPVSASMLATIAPNFPPVTPVMSDFTFANFRGANILGKTYVEAGNHLSWIPQGTDLSNVLTTAKNMNLNVLRLPVVIPPAAPTAADWGTTDPVVAVNGVISRTTAFLDAAAAQGFKVIIILDGYTKYGYSGEVDCLWKKSFKQVEVNAGKLISAIKSKPALYAWDVLNEPLHNASAFDCLGTSVANVDAYKSVVNAVHAMYNLVNTYDRAHLTTVGEGNGAFVKYWQDISSFVSYHQYYNFASATSHPSQKDYDRVKDIAIGTYNSIPAYWGDRPWPVVVTEYGIANDTTFPQKQYDYYKNYLLTLKGLNVGSALWSLSPTNALRVNGPAMTCLISGIQTNDSPVCPTP